MINLRSIVAKTTVIPKYPKPEKKKRQSHQDGLKDTKVVDIQQDIPYNRDIDLGNDRKDDMSMFEHWFREIFENLSKPYTLPTDSVNFPGVYPGTSFASLKLAEVDLKLELLKALSRAQDLGLIKDYKNTLIEIDGKKYTYNTLPKRLIEKAIKEIQNKIQDKAETPNEPENKDQNSLDDLLNAGSPFGAPENQQPDMLGKLAPAMAAARFPANQDILGETYTNMPEQTDNKIIVDNGPVAPKQTKPMQQFDGSYPWIEDGNGSENPYARIWDALYSTYWFFGV
jgi:hypothetical protein